MRDVEASSDDGLWGYVEACQGTEASKAADVRVALEASLGKERTKQLLSKTKAIAARNAAGHKMRVLRSGVRYLRLKR